MPILDIILLLSFVPAIVGGLSKGFVRQAAELAAILLAAWAACHFTPALGEWLDGHFSLDPGVSKVLAFLLVVIVTALLLNWAGALVTGALKVLSLGFFNRLLGMVFAILKVALVLGLAILLFETLDNTLHLLRPGTTENAVVYQALKHAAETVFPRCTEFFS